MSFFYRLIKKLFTFPRPLSTKRLFSVLQSSFGLEENRLSPGKRYLVSGRMDNFTISISIVRSLPQSSEPPEDYALFHESPKPEFVNLEPISDYGGDPYDETESRLASKSDSTIQCRISGSHFLPKEIEITSKYFHSSNIKNYKNRISLDVNELPLIDVHPSKRLFPHQLITAMKQIQECSSKFFINSFALAAALHLGTAKVDKVKEIIAILRKVAHDLVTLHNSEDILLPVVCYHLRKTPGNHGQAYFVKLLANRYRKNGQAINLLQSMLDSPDIECGVVAAGVFGEIMLDYIKRRIDTLSLSQQILSIRMVCDTQPKGGDEFLFRYFTKTDSTEIKKIIITYCKAHDNIHRKEIVMTGLEDGTIAVTSAAIEAVIHFGNKETLQPLQKICQNQLLPAYLREQAQQAYNTIKKNLLKTLTGNLSLAEQDSGFLSFPVDETANNSDHTNHVHQDMDIDTPTIDNPSHSKG